MPAQETDLYLYGPPRTRLPGLWAGNPTVRDSSFNGMAHDPIHIAVGQGDLSILVADSGKVRYTRGHRPRGRVRQDRAEGTQWHGPVGPFIVMRSNDDPFPSQLDQ